MPDSKGEAAVAFSTAYSESLLAVSPVLLVLWVLRKPKVAIYMASETLVLLSYIYLFRYEEVEFFELSMANAIQKMHLIGLFVATVVVLRHQRRTPQIPTDGSESEPLIDLHFDDEDGAKVVQVANPAGTPITSSVAVEPREAVLQTKKSTILFNKKQFFTMLSMSILVTAYSGKHSLLMRAMNWYDGKPNPPFWDDFFIQLQFLLTLLEVNAYMMHYIRALKLRDIQPLPPTVQVEVGLSTKERVKQPNQISGFLWTSQLAAALLIPSLVQKMKGPEKTEDEVIYRLIGCSFQVVLFVGFIIVYHFVRPNRRIRLEESEQSTSPSSIRV